MHLMPTLNPRITITLKPEVHAVLKRLSGLTENSQSAIVSELLESSLPVFERMAAVLEAAQAAKEGMASDIADGLARAQNRIEAQMGLILDDVDQAWKPILEQGEKVARRRGRAPAPAAGAPAHGSGGGARSGGLTPVPVTRGSGLSAKGSAGAKKGGKSGRV
jgi:hypothetical protein